MNIGIIGSGVVGQQLGLGLARIGHNVKIGTREPSKLADWKKGAGNKASVGSTAEAAEFGEVNFLATAWSGTKDALNEAGKDNFSGKILVDVTNPLDFSHGTPPGLLSSPGNSAGEQVSNWLPGAKVVKAFNTVSAFMMTNPFKEEGMPDLWQCGDEDGKEFVKIIAQSWGWNSIIDIGDLSKSYLLEALAQLWIEYGFKNGTWTHAFKLLRK